MLGLSKYERGEAHPLPNRRHCLTSRPCSLSHPDPPRVNKDNRLTTASQKTPLGRAARAEASKV